MDGEEVVKVLKALITQKSDIDNGFKQIMQLLTDNNLPVVKINVEELKKEFNDWLSEVIEKEPIPRNIKSIYFGLVSMKFEEIDNGKEKTTVYISGSRFTPDQDADWASDTEFFPKRRYVLLDEFERIDSILKGNPNFIGCFEVLVFNGLLNLLVLNSIYDLEKSLMTYQTKKLGLFKTDTKRDILHFGTGYDSGDVYLIGKLNNE